MPPKVPNFDPTGGVLITGGPGVTPSLPAGKKDVYGTSKMPDGVIFLGQTHVDEGAYHGRKNNYAKPGDLLSQYGKMAGTNPSQYAATQYQLYQAGYYGSTRPVFGNYNSTRDNGAMQNAINSYLGVVNAQTGTPLTFAEFLARGAAQGQSNYNNGEGAGGGAQQSAPAPIQVSDPESIKAAVQSAAQQALGRSLDDAQLEQFVKTFQDSQRGVQTATTGEVTQPDLGADAMAYVQGTEPGEFKKAQTDNYLGALVNLLGGGEVVQRATFTPTPSTRSAKKGNR